MRKIGKYEFDTEELALTAIASLGTSTDEEGNEYPTHPHGIVKLGNIVLEQGEYDEEGEEITSPVLSDKYHLDVAWDLHDTYDEEGNLILATHSEVWGDNSVNIDSEGVHGFFGISYLENKM